MIRAEVKLPDLGEVRRNLRFSIARALTLTAKESVDAVQSEMPRQFLLRRSWVLKGIRFDLATPEGLEARVYSIDPYMVKQEDGELYSPDGSHVAIPAGIRSYPKANIPAVGFRALRGSKSVFKAEIRGTLGLWERKEKGGLRLLYLLKKTKATRAAWGFEDTVNDKVQQSFDKHFTQEKED